jgi:hypothetical protein
MRECRDPLFESKRYDLDNRHHPNTTERIDRMKMNIVPAVNGRHWMTKGFHLYRKNAKSISLITFIYALVVTAPTFLPVVGTGFSVVVGVLGPALFAGLISIYRALDRGQGVSLDIFLRPARTRLAPLCGLGAANLFFMVIVFALGIGVFMLISGEGIDPLLRLLIAAKNDALTPDDLKQFMQVFLAFAAGYMVILLLIFPLIMAYYFAPLLIAWEHVPVGKAAVFSFVACLKNWRPFLLFGLFWMVGIAMLGTVAVMLIGIFLLVLPKALAFPLAALLYVATLLIILSCSLVFYYVSYQDIFVPDDNANIGAGIEPHAALKS